MAGTYRQTMPAHVPTLGVPVGVIWIRLNGVYHHHFPAKAIRNHVHGPSLKSYILKNTGWTVSAFESIEWGAYEKVLTDAYTGLSSLMIGSTRATRKCTISMNRPVGVVANILSFSNRNLSRWIHRPFRPAIESQTTLDQFFRP